MLARYPATFSDHHGVEETVITNDDDTLRMTVRGVEFVSEDFDDFEPVVPLDEAQSRMFTLHQGGLIECRVVCEMPLPIQDHDRLVTGTLRVDLWLGHASQETGRLMGRTLDLSLVVGDVQIESAVTRELWFEDQLLDLQRKLPEGMHIKACITCLYSDYSPFGHGAFGSMLCFRNVKDQYLAVTSKESFWPVLERHEMMVQETYLCEAYTRRIEGTGYRG